MRLLQFLFFQIFILTLTFSLTYAENESNQERSVNSILATVDGEAITLLDLLSETKDKEERIKAVYAGNVPIEEVEKIRKEALELLINEKLILNEFKKRSYKVPPQMVERMLDALAEEFSQSDRERLFLIAQQNKISPQKLRKKAEERAAIELMLNEFCSRNIYVSPKEIQDKLNYSQKEKVTDKVEIYAIYISKDKEGDSQKKEIVKKIQEDSGKNNLHIFMTLAKLYSENQSATNGGYLGWLEKEKLRSEFTECIKNLKKGQVSEPINTNEGTYFIYLNDEKKHNNEIITYEQVKESILKEKIENAKKEFAEKLRKNAIIRYFY